MEKLYFLRRARSEIHGPFRKGELKSFLSSYEHFSDWEVSGSLGPWIYIDNEQNLKQHYSDMWQELSGPAFSFKNLFHRKK